MINMDNLENVNELKTEEVNGYDVPFDVFEEYEDNLAIAETSTQVYLLYDFIDNNFFVTENPTHDLLTTCAIVATDYGRMEV